MDIGKLFQEMASAPVFGKGTPFQAGGKYRVRTKALKYIDGYNGKFFIVECEVLESDKEADPVGTTRTYTVKFTGDNKTAFSDIKSLLFALAFGVDPSKVPPYEINPALHNQAAELARIVCDPAYAATAGASANILDGRTVKLETTAKPTKPSPKNNMQGGIFTVHRWLPDTTAQPSAG